MKRILLGSCLDPNIIRFDDRIDGHPIASFFRVSKIKEYKNTKKNRRKNTENNANRSDHGNRLIA